MFVARRYVAFLMVFIYLCAVGITRTVRLCTRVEVFCAKTIQFHIEEINNRFLVILDPDDTKTVPYYTIIPGTVLVPY